ncbi:alpha/beta hydrolase fold protein [Thermoanaerobacter ethanolicus JW 200]|uniref:alpha/beta fold hydrolase n=1 Tax=Thermoanaerobacter ethanolicus TaxID=1757 RepID=UPI000202C790|nr:alpha/beta hydrolase fold protein [Thermoanaerobacter ethanolicus JW 200]
MAKVRVNNIELYYEIHGNGQPLVLIEGLGCSKWMWFKQIYELKKYFKVIVFDLRGVGDSDKPDMEYSIKLFADDTAALVTELGFKKVHILGVSMGGYIAQELALEYPALVDRLILCSTHYGGPNIVPIPLSTLSIMLNGTGAGNALENLRIAMSLNFSDEYLSTHKDEFEQIVKWKFEKPQPFYAYKRQFYAGLAFDEESRVHLIKSPTLIMAGKDDKIVPYENALLLHSKIEDSEVEFFDNAGHMFFIEKAEEVNQKIVEFLTKPIGGDEKWKERILT